MTNELNYLFYAGTSTVIAIVSFGIIWWQQSKQLSPLGFGKLLVVFLATWMICFISFVIFMVTTEFSGFRNIDSFMQPLGIAAGIVGYFAGNKLALRLAAQPTK